MVFPNEFKNLAFDTLSARLMNIKSEEQLREHIISKLTTQERQRLAAYLTEILDGHFTDEEINALWDKTGSDFMFFRPEAARHFLLKVKEWLARDDVI